VLLSVIFTNVFICEGGVGNVNEYVALV